MGELTFKNHLIDTLCETSTADGAGHLAEKDKLTRNGDSIEKFWE